MARIMKQTSGSSRLAFTSLRWATTDPVALKQDRATYAACGKVGEGTRQFDND